MGFQNNGMEPDFHPPMHQSDYLPFNISIAQNNGYHLSYERIQNGDWNQKPIRQCPKGGQSRI